LDNQRLAVKEEKRLRVDNQPYAASFEEIDALAYDAFAYRHPVIGSMDDLDAASLDDALDFYRLYYAPGNALLCIAGDVEADQAFEKASRAFGGVPPREVPPRCFVDEPLQTRERRSSVVDPHASLPALHIVFKVPPRRHSDLHALSMLDRILGGGESSRLWRRLVKDEEKALSLSINLDERRGPSLLRFFSVARPGTSLDEIEAAIWIALDEIASVGPTAAEMERARRMILSEAVRATQTTQAVAFLLSEYGLYDDDPGLWRTDYAALLEVDGKKVQEVAGRLLVRTSASILAVHPATGSGEPSPGSHAGEAE
jgi:predicted Zn-dependent peptidase